MKSPITDASRMTAIRKLSPFLIVLPDWKSKLSIRMADELHVAIKISNEKSACRKSSIASDWVLGSRHRDVAAGDCQFGWLQGVRNLLRQNSFWLQRPDLN